MEREAVRYPGEIGTVAPPEPPDGVATHAPARAEDGGPGGSVLGGLAQLLGKGDGRGCEYEEGDRERGPSRPETQRKVRDGHGVWDPFPFVVPKNNRAAMALTSPAHARRASIARDAEAAGFLSHADPGEHLP